MVAISWAVRFCVVDFVLSFFLLHTSVHDGGAITVEVYASGSGCQRHVTSPFSTQSLLSEESREKGYPVCSSGGGVVTAGVYIRVEEVIGGTHRSRLVSRNQIRSLIDIPFWWTKRISKARVEPYYRVLTENGALDRLLHYNRSI